MSSRILAGIAYTIYIAKDETAREFVRLAWHRIGIVQPESLRKMSSP